jgi:hypothetical protein
MPLADPVTTATRPGATGLIAPGHADLSHVIRIHVRVPNPCEWAENLRCRAIRHVSGMATIEVHER